MSMTDCLHLKLVQKISYVLILKASMSMVLLRMRFIPMDARGHELKLSSSVSGRDFLKPCSVLLGT